MRIGEFSELNNLSIDTVRYYVDLKLINPIRKGRYYYFEEDQQEELDRLLYLKKLNFTLEEIKKIMLVEKLKKIETIRQSSVYEKMLLEKKDTVEKEIRELSEALKELDKEISYIKERQNDNLKERGISFKNFQFIRCPKCGNEIEFNEGALRGNGIYKGKGQCICGYYLSIDEGIIVSNNNKVNMELNMDVDEGVNEFVNESPKAFIDFMMYSLEEVIRILTKESLLEKSLLFMKSGLGPLELRFLQKTNDIGLMIIVDDDLNNLRVVKKSIERNFPKVNALYICSELNELPLKKGLVDIAIDFLATFIHGFRVDFDIYEYIIPLLKKESSILGLYLYFKQFNMLSRLDENKRKLFDGTVSERVKNYNYIETGNYDEVILHEGNNINNFFQDGDKVNARIMTFHRKSNK